MGDDGIGTAIRHSLEGLGRSQSWLGAEVARIEDQRTDPYSQAAVSAWITEANTPSPTQVFAIEKALQMRPGTLSRKLGYLPVTSRSARTVPEAIDADAALTASGRRIIRAVYEELTSSGHERVDSRSNSG